MLKQKPVIAVAMLVLLAGAGVLGWQVMAAVNGPPRQDCIVAAEDSSPQLTRDDKLLSIAEEVPGFGGMYMDPDNQGLLYVYLQDPDDTEQLAKVRDII